MDSEDRSKRLEAVRSVRSQRDAAEKALPRERLRREIRQAFERQEARDRAEDPAGPEADPNRPPGS